MLLAFIANVIVYIGIVAVYIHFDKKDMMADNKGIPNRKKGTDMNVIKTVKAAMNAYGKQLIKAQEYGLVIEQNK